MTTRSVFLVTHNDGDYYTRHAETLAAFTSRDAALEFAFNRQVDEIELYNVVLTGLAVEERRGSEVVSTLDVVPRVGVSTDSYDDSVTDRDAVYRDLGRILS